MIYLSYKPKINFNIQYMTKPDDTGENETFFSSIVENIPDMIFIKDAKELRFVHFNKAGEELLGYKKNDLLGKNDYDFFTKDQADFFTKNDREVLANKKVLDIPEEKIKTKFKGERILHTKKIPILNDLGEPIYLLGISEDVTDLRNKITELNKMNQFMIDREIKMVELKEEIQKLKNQLK